MVRHTAEEAAAPSRADAVESVQDSTAAAAHDEPRSMRTDALKNRQRILDAAEEIFAAEGVTVPIDAVAERAGLGVGTLYRHFPNKEALFEAIVLDRLERLLATAKAYEGTDDRGEALFEFLGELADQAASKRDLFEALGSAGIDLKSRCSSLFDELMAGVEKLLARAVEEGTVRDDVSANEVVVLIVGACHTGGESGLSSEAIRRMVGVVLDGLRPAASHSAHSARSLLASEPR